MAGAGGDEGELLRQTERWFLRRGLPHLIEGYGASEDVFTRSVGVLGFIALVEVVNAVRLEWRWWQNTLALIGGAALLVGSFVVVNLVRGRPRFQRPDDVGPVELTLFVALPALVVGVFGEAWQVASALPVELFALTGAMFVTVGLLFLLTRLPAEVRRLDDELGDGGLAAACVGTPMEGVVVDPVAGFAASGAGVEAPPLSRRQRLNVYLVFLFAQGVQAVLVSLAVFAFFTAFGLVAIRPVVIDAWLGDIPRDDLVSWTLFGHPLHLTTALVHVSGFVAFVAGFSFTVSMVTDSSYREEFFDEVVGQVRQALGVRTVYLALRSRS